MAPRREQLWDAGAVLALAAVLAVGHAVFSPLSAVDSDRHYHLAVSRAVPWHGRLHALPQVADLGWGAAFVDKDYLFHVFTGWGYHAGGEAGVELVLEVLELLAVLGLYALCRTAAAPGVALALSLSVALGNLTFLYRLQMLRPQVLAIGLFLWLAYALSTRRGLLALVAGAAFALAYHAFYLPLVLVVWQGALFWRERQALRTAALAVAGMCLGLVLHPAWPRNLTMTFTQLRIGLGAQAGTGSGLAMLPLTTKQFMLQFGGPVLIVALVLLRPWSIAFADQSQRRRVIYWGGAALAFWGFALLTPRGAEYAVPLSAVIAAVGFADRPKTAVALAGLALLCNLPGFVGSREVTASNRYAMAVLPAVARLPPSAAGRKVFNCSFDEGSVLLDLRPDVRVVDVLDPSLLKQAAPELASLRTRFQEGKLADPAGVVSGAFHADYVLCGYPEAVAMMDHDPRFVRLNPPPGPVPREPTHFLYALREDPVAPIKTLETYDAARDGAVTGRMTLQPDSVFFDLRRAPRDPLGCVTLRVPPSELAKFPQATAALLGGGPSLALERDGEPLFLSRPPLTPSRWNEVLVPLSPITSESRLHLRVCPSGPDPVDGVALSLWTMNQIETWCGSGPDTIRPRYVDTESRTCLAPWAQ